MNITFFKIKDERNAFPKKLVDILHPIPTITISGRLRDECDILNPVIVVEGDFLQYNYCHIGDLGDRYYFIEDWNIIRSSDVTEYDETTQQMVTKQRTPIMEMRLHVDVLQTYRVEIMEHECLISRTEMEFNYERDDNGNIIYDDNNPIPIRVADKMQVDSKWISKPNFEETLVGYDYCVDNTNTERYNIFSHYNEITYPKNFVLLTGGVKGNGITE